MSALAWTRFRYLTRPSRLLRAIIDDVAKFIERKRARWSPYATLERCSDKLEHLRSLVRAISPQRRRKIQTAAERGVCKRITDIEAVLEGYYIDYYKLCELHREVPFHMRYWPSTRLHQYMLDLEHDLMVFFRDVWNTTAPGDRSIAWGTDWGTTL